MIKFFFIEKYSETLYLKKNYTRILSGNNSIYNQFLSIIGSEIKKKIVKYNEIIPKIYENLHISQYLLDLVYVTVNR